MDSPQRFVIKLLHAKRLCFANFNDVLDLRRNGNKLAHFARILAAAIVCAATTFLHAAEFQVGVASVDITPTHPVRLNGFGGRHAESTGVRQAIYAKALVVGTTDDDAVVVVTVDTLGIPDLMTERIAERLKARVGLDRARFAISASHTHTGPMIKDCANTLYGVPIPDDHWQRILDYTARLEAAIEQVAIDALAARKPATLSWGVGRVTFAENRRTRGGPVDHDLPVLVVHNMDGSLRAVFTNYACHCVTLSDTEISGDWAGYAQDHIQRQNPGCTALIAIGCGADANPRGGVLGGQFEVADSLGLEIAAEVQRLHASGLTPITKGPVSRLDRVSLPLAPLPSRERWEELSKADGAVSHYAKTQLARLDHGEALMTEISYPIQSIAFGDELAWLFLPGEVVVDYATRLKRELDGGRLWINAYSNACPGYVPSERILREGGYEGGGAMVYYDIPGPYAAGLEDVIVTAVRRQLDESFRATVDVAKTDGIRPPSPEVAVRALRVATGLRVELVAAEPFVQSPVAIAFDPDGRRVWVAEMRDYPRAEEAARQEPRPPEDTLPKSSILDPKSSSGAVRCLHDDNGDGRMDRADVFIDGLPYPTGVTVWRNGVLICAAPDILYAEDTNGDGRADKVEKLFTGFATHNFQARVNSLEYGLDGWVYGSCGLFGGTITSVKTGQVIELGGRDFRCKPDTGEFEPVTGSSQQGRVRNDDGDWFGCNNTTPLMHYPLDDAMLRRNPFLIAPQTTVVVADGGLQLLPVSNLVLFALSGPPGRPTAACGLGIYRDELLGTAYHGNAFVCEPVNNLVTRLQLEPRGATFDAERAVDEQDREFLTSSNPWFRPVQVRTAPDGTLWIVDMSRYVIEHPIWIPPDRLAQLDPRAGSMLGRIYRVVRDDAKPRAMPNLRTLKEHELTRAMDSPNGTQRDLVQQLLEWDHADSRGATVLLEIVEALGKSDVARAQALTMLGQREEREGIRHGSDGRAFGSSREPSLTVRRAAMRSAAGKSTPTALLAAATLHNADDASAFVRIEAAYAARSLAPDDAARVLKTLLMRTDNDEYLLAAIESSFTPENLGPLVHELRWRNVEPLPASVVRSVGAMATVDAATELLETASIGVTVDPNVATIELFTTFLTGWQLREHDEFSVTSEANRAIWQPAWTNVATVAADETVDAAIRQRAIEALRFGEFLKEPATDVLLGLLSPQTDPQLQQAAVEALAESDDAEIAAALLADWPARSPGVRSAIVSQLLEREAWTQQLLEAATSGAVSSSDIALTDRQQLMNHADDSIRKLAESAFKQAVSPDRAAVFERYLGELPTDGSVESGRRVFAKHCGTCHLLKDDAGAVGHEVGPGIAGYAVKPSSSLLESLLNPGQAVDPRYQNYVVVLNDGRSVNGLVRNETSAGFDLLAAEAKRTTVRRSEVEELRSTGKSLMPDGLEQTVSPRDVADLLAWLRTLQTPFKSLPGNQPTVVDVPAAGAVALLASQAEIRGGDITFEQPFQNIGYWHGADDSVLWRVRSEQTRTVDVWIEFACDARSSGHHFVVEGLSAGLRAQVPSTGTWSNYQLLHLGTRIISAGDSTICITPDGDPRSAMMDLRAVHLVDQDTVPLAAGSVKSLDDDPGSDPMAIAKFLLDDSIAAERRETVIASSLKHAADIIPLMAADLPTPSGSPEEYRRIPWIWRVAIAAGKSGNSDLIRAVLERSLPEPEQPLTHWQAVVIGGGLINGLSLSSKWPHDELLTLIGEDRVLLRSWQRTLELSATMADDESVPTGTRYDALRMIALRDWSIARPQLERYLAQGTHDELQMGAISGLSDVQHEEAGPLLLSGLIWYSDENRRLAIEAMLRMEGRCLQLLGAVESGALSVSALTIEQLAQLKKHASEPVRNAAANVIQ